MKDTIQPYAWLGAAGVYRSRLDGVANGEQFLTPRYTSPFPEAASLAASDVLAERRWQIEQEHWCPEHDDKYIRGELAVAVAAYATAAHWHAVRHKGVRRRHAGLGQSHAGNQPPQGAILVKAGALILAEIERLDRMERIQQEAGQ